MLSGIQNSLLKIARLAIYTNFYIAAGAVAFAMANLRLNVDASFWELKFLWLTIFSATILTYQMSRWAFHQRPVSSPNKDSIYRWLDNSLHYTRMSIVISGVLLIWAVIHLKSETVAAFAIAGVVSLLYPIEIKWRHQSFRLRDIPFLKIFLIAFVWSYMAVIIPKVEWLGWDVLGWKDIWYFLLQFVFILVITLPFDINDYRIDQLTSVKTIPGWIGIPYSKLLTICLSIVYVAGFGCLLYIQSDLIFTFQQWGLFFSITLLIIALSIKTLRYSNEVSKWKIMLWYDGSFFWYWLLVMLWLS